MDWLTYFKGIDHGGANGLLMSEYLRLVEQRKPELAEKILAALGLPSLDRFREGTGLLFTSKEKISKEEILRYSGKAIKTGNIGNCIVKPAEEDI